MVLASTETDLSAVDAVARGLLETMPGPAALLVGEARVLAYTNVHFDHRIGRLPLGTSLEQILASLPSVPVGRIRAKVTEDPLDLLPTTRRSRNGDPVQFYAHPVTEGVMLLRVEAMPASLASDELSVDLERTSVTTSALVEALYTAPVPLLVLDPQGRVAVWNQAFLQINSKALMEVGITLRELLSRYEAVEQDWGLGVPHDATAPWIDERIAQHENYTGPFEEMMGDDRWFLTSEHRAADGSTLILHTDITEQKRAAASVAKAREQAEAANRAKSDFLALMSHDLRTPLNAILGFAELIRDDVLDAGVHAAYRDYAKDIHQGGVHLLELVNTILDLAKIEAGRYDLEEEEAPLAEDAEQSLRILRKRFMGKGLKLSFEDHSGGAVVRYDRRCLRQMVLNLLSNSEKFTPRGGTVSVTIRRSDDGLVVEVIDTGIGISAADMPRVLEPFGQVRRREDSLNGTGLGLPLVRSLIDRHQGSFEISSEPNVGTTVTLTFPASRIVDQGGLHEG